MHRFHNLRIRWKMLLAPALLIVVIVALSAYAISILRANQKAIQDLVSGPLRQAEIVSDFTSLISGAHVRLYRLTATAANETDQKKIKTLADQSTAAVKDIADKVKVLDGVDFGTAESAEMLDKLRAAVTSYLKQANYVIDMADGQAGSALMFMVTAERSFAQIDKLTDDLTMVSNDIRDREIARANARLEKDMILLPSIALAAIIAGFLVSVLVGIGIAKPVVQIAGVIRRIAHSDFNVDIPAIGQRDEIGVIAASVQVFKNNMLENERLRAQQKETEQRTETEKKAAMQALADEFQTTVGHIADKFSMAANQLQSAAFTLTKAAEHAHELSSTVATASEQTSANVHSVASASEEVSTSVAEIVKTVEKASAIAHHAVKQAGKTDSRMVELSQAASRIGDVVKLITDIAQQTNLLALNATIEAARAGEAGKGFAVVAQEVKALASQTAKATEDIGTQIAAMQSATNDSVSAIHDIGKIITEISEIAIGIAAAMEEQGNTIQSMSHSIVQAAQGTSLVASHITDVNHAASQTGSASAQVLTSAKELAEDGSRLKQELDKFLMKVRAA